MYRWFVSVDECDYGSISGDELIVDETTVQCLSQFEVDGCRSDVNYVMVF